MKWNFGTGIAVVYSIFAISMVTAAVRSTYHDVGLIKKDYYDDDLNYQAHYDKIQNEKLAAEHVTIRRDNNAKVVILAFPKAQKAPKGKVTFFRPSKVGIDQTFDIETDAQGEMKIPTQQLISGVWKVQIDWTASEYAYFKEVQLTL